MTPHHFPIHSNTLWLHVNNEITLTSAKFNVWICLTNIQTVNRCPLFGLVRCSYNNASGRGVIDVILLWRHSSLVSTSRTKYYTWDAVNVSEFEHICGQILTTPSCVYGRLFTWIRMVDFNALIVRKTFIDICFSIKSSLWALTAAYTKFRRMIGSMI